MNIYYYTYYILAKAVKKLNRRDTDFAFTGIMILDLLIAFNIITIVSYIGGKAFIHTQPKLIGGGLAVFVGIINYFILMRDKKYKTIISEYDAKYRPVNRWHILLVATYAISSFAISIYIATIVRNQNI
jgi:hypothetical protein